MRPKHPVISFEGCQFKSVEKVKLLAKLLHTMEVEFGINETTIKFLDVFVCPDINLAKLLESKKPMEVVIAGILIEIDLKKHGKKSLYAIGH